MTSKTHRIAKWMLTQPQGVTVPEVAARFDLSSASASSMLARIVASPHYKAKREPIPGAPSNRVNARWFVSAVLSEPAHKKPIPVIGVSMSTGHEVRFDSLTAAEDEGFDSSQIGRCLQGVFSQHAGYRWRQAST